LHLITQTQSRSARRRDLYLPTYIHKKQTSMPRPGFKPVIPTSERRQTYAIKLWSWYNFLLLP